VYVEKSATIKSLKDQVHQLKKSLNPHRQSIKLDSRGKSLKDSDTIESLNLREGAKVYVKDLGPQISWKGVFLAEYAGPLFVYLFFYTRPSFVYSNSGNPISLTTQ
jgi:very-long-chain enoyl-CoA reductase